MLVAPGAALGEPGTVFGAATCWWLLEPPWGILEPFLELPRVGGSWSRPGGAWNRFLEPPRVGGSWSLESFLEAVFHDYIRRIRMSSEHSWIRSHRIQIQQDTPEE